MSAQGGAAEGLVAGEIRISLKVPECPIACYGTCSVLNPEQAVGHPEFDEAGGASLE